MSGARLNGARLRFGSAEAAAASVDPVSGRARALAVERTRLRPLPLVFMMRGRVNLDQHAWSSHPLAGMSERVGEQCA